MCVLFFQSHVINSFYFSCVCMYIAYVHACVALGIESTRAFSCVCFDRYPTIVTYHYMHIFTQMPSIKSKHMLVHMCVLTCTSEGGHHMSTYICSHVCSLSRHISYKCVSMHATLSMVTHHHVWAFWYLWKFWSWSQRHICACWHTWKFQVWPYVGTYAHFNMYPKFWEWVPVGTYACVDRYVTSKRHHMVLMYMFPHVQFWVWSHVCKFVCLQALSPETNHMHVLTFTRVHFPVWYISAHICMLTYMQVTSVVTC